MLLLKNAPLFCLNDWTNRGLRESNNRLSIFEYSTGHSPTHSLNFLILTTITISFQRFSTLPTIFVTASHQVPKRPQDAMALWVEELRVNNFKICLREAKIFDGPHKSIKIVSKFYFRFLLVVILIHWTLPKNSTSSRLNVNHNDT